jgi:ribosome recycling factor
MIDALMRETKDHMKACIDALQKQLASLRTGKASPRLLDGITVEAYGARLPLNQVATLGAPEARLLTVAPFDRSQIHAIEKAILASDLGITPANDGVVIRLPIPPLNEERRREYVKIAKKHAEEARVAARGVRREANEKLKKAQSAGTITEDQLHRTEKDVQKLTDDTVAQIDKVVGAKENEIMEV